MLLTLSRLLGFAAAVGVITLAIQMAFFAQGFTALNRAIIMLTVPLALLVIWAALKAAPRLMLWTFFFSFFVVPPTGMYALGLPHYIKWIGVCNLFYLVAAVLMWSAQRGAFPRLTV